VQWNAHCEGLVDFPMTAHPDPQHTTEESGLEHDILRGAAMAVNSQQVAPAAAIGKGLCDLKGVRSTRQGVPQQGGFAAEVYHEATFNADAARKGLDVRATRTTGNAPADLNITSGDQVVARAQIKHRKTAAKATHAVSDTKYDGMQKVVAEGQADRVRYLSTKRGVDGLGRRNYADTSRNVTEQVEYGGAASKSLGREAAQSKSLGTRMLAGEVGTAAKSGAASGAVIGGAMSAVGNITAAINGEKTTMEATGAVVKDTALAAAGGAVSAAATSAATAGCARIGLQALSKSGAPGVIAATGIEVAKDLMAFNKGELTAGQVAGRSLEHAGGASAAWAGASTGAAIGTVLIPIPGVGTAIGGLIGGMMANYAARKAIGGVKAFFSEE
jgi:hypothetical protein